MKTIKSPVHLILLATASLLPHPLLAQQGETGETQESVQTPSPSQSARPDNVIVVTATKTGAAAIQDIPIAISAFEGDTIRDQGILDVQDVATVTPSFTFSSNGPWAIASIRGVGTNNVFAGGDPNTTIQVDGVYIARPSSGNLDFFDVERVEILRGPQGTIYGRNAIAGTINVITRMPGDELELDARATVGTEDFWKLEGRLAGPIAGDVVSASVAGSYASRDGLIEQLVPGLPDANDQDRLALRGRVLIDPVAPFRLVLSADYYEADEVYNYDTVRIRQPFVDAYNPDFHEVANDFPNLLDMQRWGVSGDLEIDLGGATLRGITAYRESEQFLQADLDNSANFLAHTVAFPEDQWQFSQEVNITGRTGDLEYIAGLFYFREDVESFTNVHFPLAFAHQTNGVRTETESIAAFAQGSWAVTDTLSLTAGLRYTDDTKQGQNTQGFDILPGLNYPASPLQIAGTSVVGPSQEISFDAFTPRFGIEFEPNDDWLIYATVTRGFKSGGFNLLTPTPDPVPFAEETLWAYEGGFKSELFDGRARLNMTAFFYDYDGLQVNQFFSQGFFGQAILNAPGAEVFGIEIETEYFVTDNFRIGANLAYLDATYDGTFLVPDDPNGSIFVNADGNRLNDAPEWSGNAFADLTVPVGSAAELNLRADLVWSGDRYYTASNNPLEAGEDYALLNLSASMAFDDGRWEVGVAALNVTDEEYITRAVTLLGITNAQPGDPFTALAFVNFRY